MRRKAPASEQVLDVLLGGHVGRHDDDVDAHLGLTDDDAELVVDEDDELENSVDERCARVWPDAPFGSDPDRAPGGAHAEAGFGDRRVPRRPGSRDVAGEGAEPVGVDGDGVDDQPDMTREGWPDEREFVVLGAQHRSPGVIRMRHEDSTGLDPTRLVSLRLGPS